MSEHDYSPLTEHIPSQDRRVRFLVESGQTDEANTLLDAVLQQPDSRTGWHRVAMLVNRAIAAWRLDRLALALELAAEGWTELDAERPEGRTAAHTLGLLGHLIDSMGHRRAALDMLRLSVEVARGTEDAETVAACLQRLGGTLNMLALEEATENAGAVFAESRSLLAEGLALVEGGRVHRSLLVAHARSLVGAGRLSEAEEECSHALLLAEEAGDGWAAATARWVLACSARDRHDLVPARGLAAEALDGVERTGDTTLIHRFAEDLADICAALDDHRGEARALRRGLAASRKVTDTLKEALGQALEQRRLAVQAHRAAVAAREAAARDPLTGLVNRLGLERSAPRLIKRTASKGRVPWLVLVDVDWFKDVNDDAGHAAGDAALREIAQLLRRECRADDLVARWAGDEFVILLVDATENRLDAGPVVAERIRAAVDTHDWRTVLGKTTRPPTVSIGVAAGPSQLDQLFTAADVALYRAKQQGRNRVEVQPPPEDKGFAPRQSLSPS